MTKTGYQGLDQHRAEHQKLVARVKALQSRHQDFLKGWLANHILGLDKQYGPHLIAAGIK